MGGEGGRRPRPRAGAALSAGQRGRRRGQQLRSLPGSPATGAKRATRPRRLPNLAAAPRPAPRRRRAPRSDSPDPRQVTLQGDHFLICRLHYFIHSPLSAAARLPETDTGLGALTAPGDAPRSPGAPSPAAPMHRRKVPLCLPARMSRSSWFVGPSCRDVAMFIPGLELLLHIDLHPERRRQGRRRNPWPETHAVRAAHTHALAHTPTPGSLRVLRQEAAAGPPPAAGLSSPTT